MIIKRCKNKAHFLLYIIAHKSYRSLIWSFAADIYVSKSNAEEVLAILGRVGRGLPKLVPGLPKQNSAPRTPLLLAYPEFAWPFDWPIQMKIPRTAPGVTSLQRWMQGRYTPPVPLLREYGFNLSLS